MVRKKIKERFFFLIWVNYLPIHNIEKTEITLTHYKIKTKTRRKQNKGEQRENNKKLKEPKTTHYSF